MALHPARPSLLLPTVWSQPRVVAASEAAALPLGSRNVSSAFPAVQLLFGIQPGLEQPVSCTAHGTACLGFVL